MRFLAKPRRRRPTGDQGVKVPAFGRFNRLVSPKHSFPQALPLGVLRLGTLMLVSTPTENSTSAAWQIRKALGKPPYGALEIVSMANDYASYLATVEEYDVQDYMGASTLWGPRQADFFAAVIKRLASEPDGVSGQPGLDAPGRAKQFDAGNVGRRRSRATEGFEALLDGGLVKAQHLPTFDWCGPPLGSLAAGSRRIEVVAIDGSSRDTEDGVIVVLRRRPTSNATNWSAVWLTPLWEPRRGVYRFHVDESGMAIVSAAFAVGSSPPPTCDVDRH